MATEPETLEQTQARLAAVAAAQARTPYGPAAGSPPRPAPPEPTGPRPDPYSHIARVQPSAAPPGKRPGKPRSAKAAGIAGVTSLVVAGGLVATSLFALGGTTGPASPEYSDEWVQFPGVSWVDPEDTLQQASYEEVVAGTEEFITQFRDALTAELGLTWSQQFASYTGVEPNGYGGDSMLVHYGSGVWQGEVTLSDPNARQRVLDVFTSLAAEFGGEGVLLRNEFYDEEPDAATKQFGDPTLQRQALWSFFDSFPSLAGVYLSVDVLDRSIPVDDSFTGDYRFTVESTDTFFVTIEAYTSALLKEADRAAFEEALEPYGGDYTP